MNQVKFFKLFQSSFSASNVQCSFLSDIPKVCYSVILATEAFLMMWLLDYLSFFSETGIYKIMVYNDYFIIIEFMCECKLSLYLIVHSFYWSYWFIRYIITVYLNYLLYHVLPSLFDFSYPVNNCLHPMLWWIQETGNLERT